MTIPGLRAVLTVLVVALSSLAVTGSARASTTLEAWMQDDPAVLSNPLSTLQAMRELGVDRVRLSVRWAEIAPDPNSTHRPTGFDGSDPASYPAMNWAPFDQVVQDAQQLGIGLDFDLLGGVPRWAEGRGVPRSVLNTTWEPSARDFGAFVRAVATRYSGSYNPTTDSLDPGDPDDLPRVSFWSVWNEPDYGPSLAPQGRPGQLTVQHSPEMYRGLVDAAWSALHATGHADDTFLFGELAPRGKPYWGVFSGMKPLVFLRDMYCLNDRYAKLRGRAARLRGCPATAAGSRRFRAANPALFEATGFSDHPYSRYFAPDREPDNDPDYTSLADIGQLERALDRVTRAYGSRTRFPIWNTEYGYITSPPKISPDPSSHPVEYYVSPAVAAAYLNQAEYMSYADPRLRSFAQYLLQDPLPRTKATDYGGFASGLLTYSGADKATYYAWRMPLYLPDTTQSSGGSLLVWGCVRPAHFALLDVPGETETAQIQLQQTGSSGWTTIAEVPITNPNGYFETHVTFPGSGAVRVDWIEPDDDPQLNPGTEIDSRSVQITVR